MSSRSPNNPAVFYIRRNDTLPYYWLDVYDSDGNPVNLAGVSSVTFSMMRANDRTLKITAQAGAKLLGPDGVTVSRLEYQWTAGDTDTPGTYYAQFECDYGGGSKRTFPPAKTQRLQIEITDDFDAS